MVVLVRPLPAPPWLAVMVTLADWLRADAMSELAVSRTDLRCMLDRAVCRIMLEKGDLLLFGKLTRRVAVDCKRGEVLVGGIVAVKIVVCWKVK